MTLSYFVGRKYLAVPYDLKRIGLYTLLVVALLAVFSTLQKHIGITSRLFLGTLLIGAYVAVLVKFDFPLSGLPIVGKYFKK